MEEQKKFSLLVNWENELSIEFTVKELTALEVFCILQEIQEQIIIKILNETT